MKGEGNLNAATRLKRPENPTRSGLRSLMTLLRLPTALVFCLSLAACASSMLGGKINVLNNYDPALLDKGRGAVMLHAINQGGLIATRWFKIDNPDRTYSFTVYRTDRHRALDQMDLYDVVNVEPGTYVLYSVFGNCEEGQRPGSTDWDEPWRENVTTALGMVSWLRSWKPGSDISTGVGIWGGSGGRSGVGTGVGFDLGSTGVGSGPGNPLAICNLRTKGMMGGKPILATVTVKAGEIVYAGELNIAYGANSQCESFGNWMTDNENRQYCGADWASLSVVDAYSAKARPFILKHLGPEAAERSVVRLAEPGSMVSEKARGLF